MATHTAPHAGTPLRMTYTLPQVPLVAHWLLQNTKASTVLAFYGDMGAGKTTLIKEICKQLGVVDNVTSPTFALINEYGTPAGDTVYHFDFYRINNIAEAYDIGAEEYLYSGHLCLIEWPQLAQELLPLQHVHIHIEACQDGQSRQISITYQE